MVACRQRRLLDTGGARLILGTHRSAPQARPLVGGVGPDLRGGDPHRSRASIDEQHCVTNNIALLAAVSAPYAVVLPALGLVPAVLGRHVVTSVLAVVVLAVSLGSQMRWYYTGQLNSTDCEHVELRVLLLNLREGGADMASLIQLARTSADVIALSELAPDWVQRFYAAGTRDDFPYSVLVPRPGAGGYGLWSRHP